MTVDDTEINAGGVRDEDSFDVAKMAAWLRDNVHPEADASGLEGVPQVKQFVGGASNLTYLLRYPTRDLILRRPPSGTKAKGAHDMRREHDIQRALRPVFGQVAQMVAFCEDTDVIGSEFYVMERLEGVILRRDIPAELNMSSEQVRKLCLTAIDTLLALHHIDVESAGLSSFGKGTGYVERQVTGWSSRYNAARTFGDEHGTPSFAVVMKWLADNQPQDVANCLIHNDFRFDNLVLDEADPTRVIGVLDWEMATLGDPLMDLGGALAYWIQADDPQEVLDARRQPTNASGMLTRDEVWDYYREHSDVDFTKEDQLFYSVFGLFRLAVIAQQIYYRYAHGQTHNPVYARFRPMIFQLHRRSMAQLGLTPEDEAPEDGHDTRGGE